MPSSTTAHQKFLVQQFVSLTAATDRQASRFLRASGYKVNEALDAYYAAVNEPKAPTTKLQTLFNSLIDDKRDENDKLEVVSTMEYLSDKLQISLENAELFVALEIVQAPCVGEITRKGYVDGWAATGTNATHQDHAAYLRSLISKLHKDLALFRKVYRYTFVAGRERDQRALSLENALVYWSMLFSSPGMVWQTRNHDWSALWKSFLEETWTRSVNRDMWNMILEFACKSLSDEHLSFWSEDGAWPSVIDDFVRWCCTKGIGTPDSTEMDGVALT